MIKCVSHQNRVKICYNALLCDLLFLEQKVFTSYCDTSYYNTINYNTYFDNLKIWKEGREGMTGKMTHSQQWLNPKDDIITGMRALWGVFLYRRSNELELLEEELVELVEVFLDLGRTTRVQPSGTSCDPRQHFATQLSHCDMNLICYLISVPWHHYRLILVLVARFKLWHDRHKAGRCCVLGRPCTKMDGSNLFPVKSTFNTKMTVPVYFNLDYFYSTLINFGLSFSPLQLDCL